MNKNLKEDIQDYMFSKEQMKVILELVQKEYNYCERILEQYREESEGCGGECDEENEELVAKFKKSSIKLNDIKEILISNLK